MKLPQASSDSGSLTGLYTPSPDLTNMSLSLSDTFTQASPNSTKDLHLEFFNAKNNTLIKNVSFFINATENGKVLMKDLFYAKTGSITMKFSPGNDTKKWTVTGNHDPVLGGWMSENDTLPITTSTFTGEGTYHIHFTVLALVYVNGIVDQSNPPTFDSWWSIDDKGNISKYDNNTIEDTLNIDKRPVTDKTLSPLNQFKSGTLAKDVTCQEGLQLVIKSHDKSPACLRPDTAYQLIYRGWANEFVQSVLNKSQSSECEGTLVTSGDHRTNTFPVLAMSANSTATVCVTYHFKSDWDSYPNKDTYPHGILETCCFVHVGYFSAAKPTPQFDVIANPPLFNVTGVINGSKVTVMYKIHAGPDSKGFYDTSIPFDSCNSYPLAVGYGPSDVDATKFHADFDIPCYNAIDGVDSVNIVSGMTYKVVQFP